MPDPVDPERLPAHVAIVMDGNGRWAERRGLARTQGHAAGEEALFDTVEGAIDLGLGYLSVFAFSTENWNRSEEEVAFLMGFNRHILLTHRDDLNSRSVRVRFAGRRAQVPEDLLQIMDETAALTVANPGLTFTICFNYGGRAEIVDAARLLAADAAAGRLGPADVDEAAIRARLYFPDTPDPDLVIRTSGEMRISNFLLWESAYAEYLFTDTLWPDFRRDDLVAAVAEYQRRRRTYGGVPGE